jgi:hypothetical protein
MSHERSNDWGFGSAFALVIALGLVSAFVVMKAVVLIIHTFVKYPRKVVLWTFLAGFVVSTGVGGLIAYLTQNPGWLSLGLVGFAALTLVCYIVELRNSQMLLSQPNNIVQSVLHTNWFGDTQDAPAA